MWVNVYMQQLDGFCPSRGNAMKFLEGLKNKRYKQNTCAIVRNTLHWKFDFDLPSIKVEVNEPKYISVDDVNKLIDKAPTLLEKTIMNFLFPTDWLFVTYEDRFNAIMMS